MVSTAWVASKLNPYARWIKMAAYALAAVALVSAGWVTNGWRLGAQIAHKDAARQTALTERNAKAIHDALEAVTRSQAALDQERKANTKRVASAVQKAPKAPQYACRDIPLPEDYLEEFRK